MATLTLKGKLVDLTTRPVEDVTNVTVKAPAPNAASVGTITTQPRKVDLSSDGSFSLTVAEGTGWLFVEGPGWSDSIRFVAKAGMTLFEQARLNAGPWPIPLPLAENALELIQSALDAAISSLNQADGWAKGLLDPAKVHVDNAPEGFSYMLASSAQTYGMPIASGGIVETFVMAGMGKFQRYFTFNNSVIRMWVRFQGSTGWTSWQEYGITSEEKKRIEWAKGRIQPSSTPTVDSLDDGFYEIWTSGDAQTYNLPHPSAGTVEVFKVGKLSWQRFQGYADGHVETYVRHQGTAGFTPWERLGSSSSAAVMSVAAPVSGYKVVPLVFTLPGSGAAKQAVADGAVRWARNYAHAPNRVRVHIRNGHAVYGAGGAGTTTLKGAKVGVGTATNGLVDAVQAFASGTVIAPGEEKVSNWIDFHGGDGDAICLTVGYTSDGAQNLHQGGGWVKNSSTGWDDVTGVTGWAFSQSTPFYVWIEAEVAPNVPVVGAHGDSISLGTAATNPVSDSWASIWALDNGALPVHFSWHGSSLDSWKSGAAAWDALYPGVHAPLDVVITSLGQNDLATEGVTVDALKSRYTSVMEEISARWPGIPVMNAAVTASSKSSDLETLRLNYNAWLRSLPLGERAYVDFASVIDTADSQDIKPEYSADGLHPNTSGQTAMAQVLGGERPVPILPDYEQIQHDLQGIKNSAVSEVQAAKLTAFNGALAGSSTPPANLTTGDIFIDVSSGIVYQI